MTASTFEFQLLASLSADEQNTFSSLLGNVRFGSLAIPWSEIVRSSHPSEVQLFYVPIRSDGTPVGLGILYIIRHLDLARYIHPRLEAVSGRFARVGLRPLSFSIGFLEIPLMNLPGILLIPEFESSRDAITARVLAFLRGSLDMDGLCVKVAPHTVGAETQALKPLRIPYLENGVLDIDYPDYEAYLRTFRSPQRRGMRKTRKRMYRHGGAFEVRDRVGPLYQELYRLFCNTAERVTAKGMLPMPFEISETFFQRLDTLGPGKLHLTLLRVDEHIAGFIFTLHDGHAREVKYFGADYTDSLFSQAYFNLTTHEIEHAIDAGCRILYVGTTSKPYKERLGCRFEPMEYLAFLEHPILRPIGNLIGRRLAGM